MTESTPQQEGWEEEFREYFDKTLKPKKPTMKNLDREICIDFISRIEAAAYQRAIREMEEGLPPERNILPTNKDCGCYKLPPSFCNHAIGFNDALMEMKDLLANKRTS